MSVLVCQIEQLIKDAVRQHPESFRFREPVIGYADADDPLYNQLDQLIGNPQLHPYQLLPSAQTVVVYFIPFSLEIITAIRGSQTIVKEWSECYTITNRLLKEIGQQLKQLLEAQGVETAQEPPTNNYDPQQLTARWSHKASAVIAGLGTFGLNRLLITQQGTAGRLGSILISARLPAGRRPLGSYCLYWRNRTCKVCVQKCPSGALTEQGFDRFRCNAYLDGKNIHDLEQGCGMCSSGPCADRCFNGLPANRRGKA